ncbi:unnamed protein product, partial [Ectocarpus sp. 4 AP-2014]
MWVTRGNLAEDWFRCSQGKVFPRMGLWSGCCCCCCRRRGLDIAWPVGLGRSDLHEIGVIAAGWFGDLLPQRIRILQSPRRWYCPASPQNAPQGRPSTKQNIPGKRKEQLRITRPTKSHPTPTRE